MIHYSGNYFCTKSHWNDGFYDVNNLVVIEKDAEFGDADFKALLKMSKFFDKEKYAFWIERKKDEAEFYRDMCYKRSYTLKPEVVQWLNKTVKDQQSGEQGWCMGNREYNSHESLEFNIFFYRRKDALAFIKNWSVFKKPTYTYSQNTYVSKKLDLKTNKLVVEKKK